LCYRGSQCEAGKYCLCGDNLDGKVNCVAEGSQCRTLPRGGLDTRGYDGCNTGAA
jgi:hypothetical protein